nr:telomere repeat-binding factor 1-like [Ipomoea batatas]
MITDRVEYEIWIKYSLLRIRSALNAVGDRISRPQWAPRRKDPQLLPPPGNLDRPSTEERLMQIDQSSEIDRGFGPVSNIDRRQPVAGNTIASTAGDSLSSIDNDSMKCPSQPQEHYAAPANLERLLAANLKVLTENGISTVAVP